MVVALVTATVSLLGGASAHARPGLHQLHLSIAKVSALLDRLGRQNEALDESYNQAAARVAVEQRRARAAARAAHAAAADADRAQNRLAMAAAQRYEAGSSDSTGLLLTSQNPQDYIDDLSSLDYLSAQFATLNTQARTTAATARTLARTAKQRLAAARGRERALRAQRGKLAARTQHYKGVLASLTEQQREAYARAREVALAKARAIAHAQALAAARSQSHAVSRATPTPSAPVAASGDVQRVVEFAEAQVGKGYTYTGTGPDSYDCSGLTMMSWRQAGVYLPHQSAAQYNVGQHVSYDDLQPGDLIFLYHPISHVEIYVGPDLAVSAADPAMGVVYVHPSEDMADYVGATRPEG